MTLIDTLNYYLTLIFAIAMAVLVSVAGILYYLLKIKKITARKETIDYGSFDRRDSLEYVKFENIISENEDSMKSPGVIHVENNTFVAGINVNGYNFATASAGERERTMVNAIAFGNIVEEPIQMRQTVKSVDLSSNIKEYQDVLAALSMEGIGLQEEYDNLIRLLEQYQNEPEEYAAIESKIKTLQRTLRAKHHAAEEAEHVIRYMEIMVSGDNKDSQKINQILFSYTFNPDEYTEEVSKEQIKLKACAALDTKAKKYANALGRCGCSCKRLSSAEIVVLMHKHCHPLTADELKMEEIFDSSYNSLFVSSDSLVELEIERLGEEEFNHKLEQYYAEQQEFLDKQELKTLQETELLTEEVNALVQKQVVGMV